MRVPALLTAVLLLFPGIAAQRAAGDDAPAGVLTVSHTSGRDESMSIWIADQDPIWPVQPSGLLIASVPKFDPALGALVGARLEVEGLMASAMRNHGINPIYVSGEYRTAFSASAYADPALAGLIGRSSIGLASSYEGFDEDWGSFDDGGTAWFDHFRHDQETYRFDTTFTGADVAPFLASTTGDSLSLVSYHSRFLFGSARHSGISLTRVLKFSNEPSGAGTKPGIGTLALVAATLVNNASGDDDHPFYFADLHSAAAAQFRMTVTYDYVPNRPPDVSQVEASVRTLWPPNHELVPVEVLGVTDPDGDAVTITIDAIRQDEPTSASAHDEHTPDADGVDTATAWLRAERDGAGNGRVYQAAFTATAGRGGSANGTVRVGVPHDRKHAAVDEGALHDATSP